MRILDNRVTPIEFMLLFTSQERVAIRAKARGDSSVVPVVLPDYVLQDFLMIIENPKLSYVDIALPSTTNALLYMASLAIITETRIAEILSGKDV